MRVRVIAIAICATAASASAAPRAVTVFLDRDGGRVASEGDQPAGKIPRFGGNKATWSTMATCVQHTFAPFRVDVVDERPADGDFITVMIGGTASTLGYDDETTNGVGPYNGKVQPNAVVHVFSKVGTGENDPQNLCDVAAHEVGHALGLDHSHLCGDLMSYYGDECGRQTFYDRDAPCGEESDRACENGKRTQNSYRQLVAAVGLREDAPSPATLPPTSSDPTDDATADSATDAASDIAPDGTTDGAPDIAPDDTADATGDDSGRGGRASGGWHSRGGHRHGDGGGSRRGHHHHHRGGRWRNRRSSDTD